MRARRLRAPWEARGTAAPARRASARLDDRGRPPGAAGPPARPTVYARAKHNQGGHPAGGRRSDRARTLSRVQSAEVEKDARMAEDRRAWSRFAGTRCDSARCREIKVAAAGPRTARVSDARAIGTREARRLRAQRLLRGRAVSRRATRRVRRGRATSGGGARRARQLGGVRQRVRPLRTHGSGRDVATTSDDAARRPRPRHARARPQRDIECHDRRPISHRDVPVRSQGHGRVHPTERRRGAIATAPSRSACRRSWTRARWCCW